MTFDMAISLGGSCQIAHQLRLNQIRSAAFPFDWIITPVESLCAFIESDFRDFLAPENLRLNVNMDPDPPCVEDARYNVLFPHDFPHDVSFLREIEHVKAKYQRRIDRFRTVLASDAKVLLMRTDIERGHAV